MCSKNPLFALRSGRIQPAPAARTHDGLRRGGEAAARADEVLAAPEAGLGEGAPAVGADSEARKAEEGALPGTRHDARDPAAAVRLFPEEADHETAGALCSSVCFLVFDAVFCLRERFLSIPAGVRQGMLLRRASRRE